MIGIELESRFTAIFKIAQFRYYWSRGNYYAPAGQMSLSKLVCAFEQIYTDLSTDKIIKIAESF